MENLELKKTAIIGAFNELSGLQAWLRPGFLAYLVGSYVDALQPHAVKLSTERAKMLDEAAAHEPETLEDGQKNPNAGKQKTRVTDTGVTITLFESPEKGDEFIRREQELFESTITIQIERKLTHADIEKIERERLPKPKPKSGNNGGKPDDATEFAVDFSDILPFIETSAPVDPALVKPDAPAPAAS